MLCGRPPPPFRQRYEWRTVDTAVWNLTQKDRTHPDTIKYDYRWFYSLNATCQHVFYSKKLGVGRYWRDAITDAESFGREGERYVEDVNYSEHIEDTQA